MERLISFFKNMTSKYFFYFLNWGYYYFSASILSYNKIETYKNESLEGIAI